jgi:hypothetical protein
MSKTKRSTKKKTADLILEEEKTFLIKEGIIKDEFCNYKFEVISGVHIGDTHSVTGKGLIKDDMRSAFAELNVHLAVIDDIFKHSNIEIENIHSIKNHELAGLYEVSGFKIKGPAESESVILIGTKYVKEAGGRMELVSPKIVMDNLSSYHWAVDLRDAVDDARKEVELYKGGKCTPVEKEESEDNPKQLTIDDQQNSDDDFEDAKVK